MSIVTDTPHSVETSGEVDNATPVQNSNYDVIRRRLSQQGEDVRTRAQALNARRMEFFGSTTLSVVGQERIRTENNCIPVDIVSVGSKLLLGYNVYIGLRKQTSIDDVFCLHKFSRTEQGIVLDPVPQDSSRNFLSDPRFVRDFEDLYTYYKDAHLLQLRWVDDKLLAVFQIGSQFSDVRVLRWSFSAQGELVYLDNSGIRDHVPAPTHDFIWHSVGREDHISGRHPHVSIRDKVFVETVGGDLTIKIEDNTEDGQGIYREPVEDKNQSLGDADIQYAELGTLIVMRILPYREQHPRYFVFNTIAQTVARIDTIGQSCVQLPEDHGLIFPGGYVLADGLQRAFDGNVAGMRFSEVIRSPNGEDVLYVFYNPGDGRYILLAYNVIRKEVQNPIHCHGYSIFDDGSMLVFRVANPDPTRVHPMQIWQTPFVSDEYASSHPTDDSFFSKIGNADLVRGISDALTIARMVDNQEPTLAVYESLIANIQRTLDSYFWLDDSEAEELAPALQEVARTAELIIDEFVKVKELQQQAENAIMEVSSTQTDILRDIRYDDWKELQRFIDGLSQLRTQRGRLITMRDIRYIDSQRLSELEDEVVENFDDLSRATINFLLGDDALTPYRQQLEELVSQIEEIQDTVRAKEMLERIDTIGQGLNLLTEVISGLHIEDPGARTRILEAIAKILSLQNRARAMIEARRRELLEHEGHAEFAIQFQLFGQSVQSAVGLADTPQKCDEMLTRVMVQLEELESRFSEFDQFLTQLSEKREDVYELFENRKQSLLQERQRRAHNTFQAAERILQGINRRASRMTDVDELNAYFAADTMIVKVRDLIESLRALEDPVRADDIQTRLRTLQDEAIRALRDKLDLYEDGHDIIRLGSHRFSVNNQDIELTMVSRSGHMKLHITGTDFFEDVSDEEFNDTRDLWNQHIVSETPQVYRAEYLAATILFAAESGEDDLSVQALHEAHLSKEGLASIVRKFMETRYDEGYERGVHDADTERILEKVVGMYLTSGLLRFSPRARALATLFWAFEGTTKYGPVWSRRAQSFGRLRETLEHHGPLRMLGAEFATDLEAFGRTLGILERPSDPTNNSSSHTSREAGAYLAEELVIRDPHFVFSEDAMSLRDAFFEHLDRSHSQHEFREDMERLQDTLAARWELVTQWLTGFIEQNSETRPSWHRALPESVALIMTEEILAHQISSARSSVEISGMLGQHPRIQKQVLHLHLDEFLSRLRHFSEVRVPRFRAYRNLLMSSLPERGRNFV